MPDESDKAEAVVNSDGWYIIRDPANGEAWIATDDPAEDMR